jgi:hypothetical protein
LKAFPAPAKTSVCKELQRRGYYAINGDRELACQGDPETGTPPAVAVVAAFAGLLPISEGDRLGLSFP